MPLLALRPQTEIASEEDGKEGWAQSGQYKSHGGRSGEWGAAGGTPDQKRWHNKDPAHTDSARVNVNARTCSVQYEVNSANWRMRGSLILQFAVASPVLAPPAVAKSRR